MSQPADIDVNALRDSFRDVLVDAVSHERVAATVASGEGIDRDLWKQASELGWLALSAPEDLGGLGLGAVELSALYQELGRVTAPVPVLGTMLVLEGLRAGGDATQQADWVPRLASGETIGAVSMVSPGDAAALDLIRDGDNLVLSGPTGLILGGDAASVLLLRASEDGIVRWVLVDAGVDGVQLERRVTVDRTRTLASADVESLRLPADRVLATGGAIDAAIINHAAVALANEGIGAAEALLDLTLEYLRTREQFGKPIGSFQALKHRCADHKVALVAAASLVAEATAALAQARPDARRLAAQAKAAGCAVFVRIATDAVQLHGGIGYTWEHPCHLYLKRAKLNEQLFGGPAAWLDETCARLREAPR